MAVMLKLRLDRLLCKIRGHRWNTVDEYERYCRRCGYRQWLDVLGVGWKDE